MGPVARSSAAAALSPGVSAVQVARWWTAPARWGYRLSRDGSGVPRSQAKCAAERPNSSTRVNAETFPWFDGRTNLPPAMHAPAH